jgi:ABC-2 type transport system ATP-binding protein
VPSAPVADQLLATLPGVTDVGHEGRRLRVTGTGDLVSVVIRALEAAGVEARDVQVEAATLDDAYLRLTQHPGPERKEAQRS